MANIAKKNDSLLPALMHEVEGKIVEVRGQKTLLDRDVAELYGVETREVNQAVKNNPRKFLDGYVLELTKEESAALRSKLLTTYVCGNNFFPQPENNELRETKRLINENEEWRKRGIFVIKSGFRKKPKRLKKTKTNRIILTDDEFYFIG